MIETKELDPNLLEAEFYEKDLKLSYSALNKLLIAPSVFYKEYVLKEKEDEFKKYLVEGTLIHYLVLDHQAFDEKFIVMSDSLPSANNMSIADEIFALYEKQVLDNPSDANLEFFDYKQEVLDSLAERNLWQNIKDDDKRAAKIIEPKTEEYFTFLKNKQGRTIIDSEMLDRCTRRAEIVKSNKKMRELLGMDLDADGINYGVYNELEVDMEKEDHLPFGFKGIIDNMVVDVKNKRITINDFKTTSKSLVDFPESVEYWNYWLQAIMYIKLATNYLGQFIDDSWNVEFNFVVFDRYDQLYAFPVSNESLAEWLKRFNHTVKEASYHYSERDYTLPYDFVVGNVNL
jgi:hypothetical protein